MYFNEEYTAIGVEDLSAGMMVNYSIFYEQDREYVLLCKNVVLNDELIAKFKKITAPNNKIYIPNEHYRTIVKNRVLAKRNAGKAVSFDGYADVKAETSELFNDTAKTQRVSPEITNAITETVHTQIKTVDVSLIIQSINGVRKVDEYLYTHSVNVALLNGLIGKWLRLENEDLNALVRIGVLHDIGKLKIPPQILNKPSKLTKEEFEIMKRHPVYSFDILRQSGITDNRILQGVIQHHEKVNGHGYPYGLQINDIDNFSRITAISDVYDAMVAKRVYKEAHSPFQILAWFAKGCYSDLDINYVNVFLDCMVEELKGKAVLLSDGSVAEVIYVHSANLEFPIVRLDGNVVNTSRDLHCVSMVND